MNKTEILPSPREPDRDRLFRCSVDGKPDVLIRVRTLEVPGQSVFVNKVDRDVLTIQLQSSVAKDETGDVQEDSDGGHVVMSASRHSFYLENIVTQGGDIAALIEQAVQDEADKAARKAWARAAVVPRLAKLA